MNNKPIYLLFAIALAASFIAILLIFIPVSATPSDISYSNIWIDNFDSASLDSRWGWVREDDSHWSVTAHPGFMRITTQPESLWESGNDQKNILLTPAYFGDFRITTKMSFTPTQIYHQAGLLVYQDDDNYIKLHRTYDYGNFIGFVNEIEGSPEVKGVAETADTVYLQISKHGNVYTGSYSLDNLMWNQVSVFTCTLTNPKVGLAGSHYITGATEIPADFDFFTLEGNWSQAFLPVMIR